MKRRLFGAVLTAMAAASMVFAAGASEPSVDEILSQYQAASKEASGLSADVSMAADVTITGTGSEDVTFKAAADVSIETTNDPVAEHMTGSYNYDLLGQTDDGSFENYITIADDGTVDSYSSTTEGVWTHSSGTDQDVVNSLKNFLNGEGDLSSLPITYTLDGTKEVDGKECYVLKAVLTWTEINDIINTYVTDLSDDDKDTLSTIGVLATGLQINIETDIAADTYQAVKARIDMDGSDWSVINSLLSSTLFGSDDSTDSSQAEATASTEAAASPEIVINDLYVEASYDYDKAPETITVPDEVIANATDESVQDTVSSLTSDLAEAETAAQ